MLEIRNTFYIQRFFAKRLSFNDLFIPVTYTQYEGDYNKIPFWYIKTPSETITLAIQDLDTLWNGMKSNTRNEIKRAEKEGCVFEYDYNYDDFVPFYNAFCASKGFDNTVNSKTLAKYDKTIITQVRYKTEVLAKHATVINHQEGCALLLYSCSTRLMDNVDKKMIGWGNRYLHWKDFELFNDFGINRYEWNGVCTNPEQEDVYKITQFKMGFGGNVKKTIGLRSPLFVTLKKIQSIF